MFLACKYEEIYAPEVKNFVYITDRAYTKDDILKMEGKIIQTLEFNFTVPSSLRFYERYSKLANFDLKSFNIGLYFLDMS